MFLLAVWEKYSPAVISPLPKFLLWRLLHLEREKYYEAHSRAIPLSLSNSPHLIIGKRINEVHCKEKFSVIRNINLPHPNVSESKNARTEKRSFVAAAGGKTREISAERSELFTYKEMLVKTVQNLK